MLLRTPCSRRIASTRLHRTHWRRMPVRRHTSDAHDQPWFQQLRGEMLHRDTIHLADYTNSALTYKLSQTLADFLPKEWCHPPSARKFVVPAGHHLVYFNAAPPTQALLPDGTDVSHSPGGPWVRRMWAGGSLQLKPGQYFDPAVGYVINTHMTSVERIKDVQLRGDADNAKIFVTVERRFARLDRLQQKYTSQYGSLGRTNGLQRVQALFDQQLRVDDGWGDALLKEERILVFMKKRTTAELDAFKAGERVPIKYLTPPGNPHFSHTLVPDRALLFRISALTINAHLIHLDRDYARDVEGHRNLLVHGPLSLTLMLQATEYYVKTHTKDTQVLEFIEYRNLAPLYCDEEMRICGLEKKKLLNGSVYDVWIEGPTGGVAVKGTVYTSVRSVETASTPAVALVAPEASSLVRKLPSKTRETSRRAVTSSFTPALAPEYRRDRPTRTRFHQFIITPTSPLPVIRDVVAVKPAKPTWSTRTRTILDRRARRNPTTISLAPQPLVRKTGATPYELDPAQLVERHSRFLREGVRLIDKPSIRFRGRRPGPYGTAK
ncbi:hypothetical protein BDW02DRAFT_573746 [Decorospora gaudefroyi]|uniref:Thioesterase/thiol ester dehydrase-isomerase n=1 Tax=Decorospora gaudefroyi TaxID=184978 RepID=A0A6A5K0I5_9PLEO|nr:hypothetical protein BDW02DRAFT_573746 [Decorospora gaudefroyi]